MGLPAVKLPGNTNTQTHILIDIHIFIIFEYIFSGKNSGGKKDEEGPGSEEIE